MLAAVDRPG